jgi:hypothetical protein
MQDRETTEASTTPDTQTHRNSDRHTPTLRPVCRDYTSRPFLSTRLALTTRVFFPRKNANFVVYYKSIKRELKNRCTPKNQKNAFLFFLVLTPIFLGETFRPSQHSVTNGETFCPSQSICWGLTLNRTEKNPDHKPTNPYSHACCLTSAATSVVNLSPKRRTRCLWYWISVSSDRNSFFHRNFFWAHLECSFSWTRALEAWTRQDGQP